MPIKEVEASLSFASPIIWFNIEDNASLNPQLVQAIQALRTRSSGVSRSNKLGWHSDADLFLRSEPCFRLLCKEIQSAIILVTRKSAPGFEPDAYRMVCNGWINVNPTHAYNSPHRHGGFVWSGTYYVQIPEGDDKDSGVLEFADPRSIDMNNRLPNSPFFLDYLKFKPTAGRLVIFPSYLLHWVSPNQDPQDRISIAFNARFDRK